MEEKVLRLKKGKERSVLNFHPWIFSGAVAELPSAKDGEIVKVIAADGSFLGRGFFNQGSIQVRLFSFKDVPVDHDFWKERIEKAIDLRRSLHLPSANTNVYRLIHGEGDFIPGLIVDIYGKNAVLQCHNHGVYKLLPVFSEILKSSKSLNLDSLYDKSSETLPGKEHTENRFLFGNNANTEVIENGIRFHIDFIHGQKTGFFIDQRENRALLEKYSAGKNVLNTFCYSGGFSLYSLRAGATHVDSVDSSKKAIELTENNVSLNQLGQSHQSFAQDTFDFFKDPPRSYDVIVLDPPAFAKHLSALKNACAGYQRLNEKAIQVIRPGGILFTFSCSQVVDKDLFRKVVFSAAARTGRKVRVLHQLSQPADHPVSIYHPEGEYLKGLVLHVE